MPMREEQWEGGTSGREDPLTRNRCATPQWREMNDAGKHLFSGRILLFFPTPIYHRLINPATVGSGCVDELHTSWASSWSLNNQENLNE